MIAGGEGALTRAYEKLLSAQQFKSANLTLHPPIADPDKIVCVGLNYRDHSQEVGFQQPEYPTLFERFSSSLVAAGDPIVCPDVSDQLDYEGELVAIVGKAGRDIPLAEALDYVAGYSVFNDVSVRDYQFRTSQWTMGKNFDDTGAFGPVFVMRPQLHLQTISSIALILQDGYSPSERTGNFCNILQPAQIFHPPDTLCGAADRARA